MKNSGRRKAVTHERRHVCESRPTTGGDGPVRTKPTNRRPRNTAPFAPGASKDAKRLAAVVLEVLAGLRTPLQAAEAISRSEAGYYQLEARRCAACWKRACRSRRVVRRTRPAAWLNCSERTSVCGVTCSGSNRWCG